MESAKPTTVVVIGGSNAGVAVSHGLLKQIPGVKVILINPSDKYYFNVAAPRVVAKPKAFSADQYIFSILEAFEQYPPSSFRFVLGKATKFEAGAKTVTVDSSGELSTISYDYLVIASGSTSLATRGQGSTKVPFKSTEGEDLPAALAEAQKTLAAARSIIIGGGGPVGVELAGELVDVYSDRKDITLVTASRQMLPSLKAGTGSAALKLLKARGVRVLSSRSVEKATQHPVSKEWTVTLDGGEKISADVYVSATGVLPNNEFIPSSFLNEDGWVKVDNEFRALAAMIDGRKTYIYAVGDITHHPLRTLYRIPGQIPVVVNNLKVEITGQGKRVIYKPSEKPSMLVPVGRSSGTGQFGGWTMWSWMVVLFKSKDFFISKAATYIS
ncbi:AMID-like mitochondrial oxidoreductase, putative [Paecilomyces variotii No. 5]|uniref:AMID-like mitochondrial oxidoreductase, putative n=1 Tax=Byssochlamys spectabilis (strain No. 5 / NBRC 109023) TaxID=1356009 RepID=V5FR09_BYSSN|nr:AMID-like mitochondrial oxidoreductase, putative [Paecilomyces variotii No. 5]